MKNNIDKMYKIINDYTEKLSTTFLFTYIREIHNGINSTKAQAFIEEQIERYYSYYYHHLTEEIFLQTNISFKGNGEIYKEKLLLATKLKIIEYNNKECEE